MNNLTVRIISALVLLPPILFLILFASENIFAAVIAAVAAIAGFEFATITLGDKRSLPRYFVASLAALVAGSIAMFHQVGFGPLACMVFVFPASAMFFMFTTKDIKVALPASAYSAVGAFYAGMFGVVALTISITDDGRLWVLLLLAGAILSDTFAYAVGRLFGKRKLWPRISPGKTWAGAFGGVLGSMIAVAVAKMTLLPQLEWYDTVALGAPLSILCQLGDLAESFIKRGFDVKDSGKIIPGHGGILDRCDALLFGAPLVFIFAVLR